MKVKPEDLRLANSVAGIKESSSGTAKKFYWNGVHKLVTRGDKLCLRTTDGTVWLDWYMPTEGEPLQLDSIVTHTSFEAPAKYMEGGSLEVSRSPGIITLKKGQQFTYPMVEQQAVGEYPEPTVGTNPTEWTCETTKLSKALRFVSGFIDETNPNANKSVATLRPDGTLVGGNPKKCAILKGLSASAEMSFKSRTARVVSTFLDRIGDNVKISVSIGENATYTFTDPDSKHQLIVLSEAGRFPPVSQNMMTRVSEVLIIDRKTLLLRCLAFAGAMKEGQDRINLTIKGVKEHASLRVWTPGEGADIAADEFSIYRTVPDKVNEQPQDKEARVTALGARGPVDMFFNREFLAATLQAMEGTSVTFRSDSQRFALLEDETVTDETAATNPVKTVLLTANQRTQDEEAPPAVPAPVAVAPPVPATPRAEPVTV